MGRLCGLHRKLPGAGPGLRCFDSRCLAEAGTAVPAPNVELVVVAKVRKTAASSAEPNGVTQALSNGKDSTNAARQARWRKTHPDQHRTTQKARWARRKAGKAAGSR